MKMKRFGKTVLCLAVLLLAMLGASAVADAKLTFSPESPKMGEYVDVIVVPDREGAIGVKYELSTSAGVVFKSKESTTHFTASFRPREETEYTLTVTLDNVLYAIRVTGAYVYQPKNGNHTPYWLREQSTTDKRQGRSIKSTGAIGRLGVTGEDVGARPAIDLRPDAIRIEGGSGTKDDPYRLVPVSEETGQPEVTTEELE